MDIRKTKMLSLISLLFTDFTADSVQRRGDNCRSTFPLESTNERGTAEGEATAASGGRQR